MKGSSLQGIAAFLLSPLLLNIHQALCEDQELAPVAEIAVESPGEPEAAAAEPEEHNALFGSWGGLKDKWAESGVTVEAVVTGDIMGLVSGGIDRGLYQTFAYQLTTSVDTETAGLWKNGTFVVSGLALTGQPLNQVVGDYQWSNNIDSYGVDTLQLYEAWYEHSFADGAVTVLFGLHDYMSDFYYLEYGIPMIQSSFSFGPELSQVTNSTYPVTSLAARIRIQPTDNSYLALAAFDGVPGSPNNYGRTTVSVSRKDGVFYAAEVGLTATEEEAETDYYKVALGGWLQTTDFVDWGERERSDNGGGYVIGERKIFAEEEDPAQGLGIFGQFGLTQGDRNFIARYIGAGLNYTGLIPGRNEDMTMFGVASAHHGSQYLEEVDGSLRAETAIELSYRYECGHGIAVQPDFQYIINPGLVTERNHAMIVGTRIDVNF